VTFPSSYGLQWSGGQIVCASSKKEWPGQVLVIKLESKHGARQDDLYGSFQFDATTIRCELIKSKHPGDKPVHQSDRGRSAGVPVVRAESPANVAKWCVKSYQKKAARKIFTKLY
jgi:hypothetical protein